MTQTLFRLMRIIAVAFVLLMILAAGHRTIAAPKLEQAPPGGNGPGGVGARDCTGVKRWYHAGSVWKDANNQMIGLWDRSGCGSNAYVTSEYPPLATVNGWFVNRPVLRFTGGESLGFDGSPLSSNPTFTAYIVDARGDGADSVGALQTDGDDLTFAFSHATYEASGFMSYYYGLDRVPYRMEPQSCGDVCGSQASIDQFYKRGSRYYYARNDLTLVSQDVAPDQVLTSTPTAQLGGSYIDIAEVLIFDRTLNYAERILIDNYLSAKYGLPVMNDRYAGVSAYGANVAGIGRYLSDYSAVARTGGLALYSNPGWADTFLRDSGDFLLTGYSTGALTNVATNLTAPVINRWSREWYLDITDTNANGGLIVLSFERSVAGGTTTPFDASTVLLYRASTDESFSQTATPTEVTADTVSFAVDASALPDGYYTVGQLYPGEVTPTPPPTPTPIPTAECFLEAPATVREGESFPVTVRCTGATGVYGFEFGTSYMGDVTANASSYTPGSFVTDAEANIVSGPNTLSQYSVARAAPAEPTDAPFSLGSVEFTAASDLSDMGSATITLTDLLLGNQSGGSIPVLTGGPVTIAIQYLLSLNLSVQSDGDMNGLKNVTATLGPDTVGESSAPGAGVTLEFTETIESRSLPLTVDMYGHLECSSTLDLTISITNLTTTLKAGDVVLNNADLSPRINLFDAVAVGLSFGPPAGAGENDINGDGMINVFDLIHVGRNYGKSSGPCN